MVFINERSPFGLYMRAGRVHDIFCQAVRVMGHNLQCWQNLMQKLHRGVSEKSTFMYLEVACFTASHDGCNFNW